MTSKIYNLVKERLEAEFVARVVSDLLNPLMMPPLVMGMVAYAIGLSNSQIVSLLGITVLFFSILPLVSAINLTKHIGPESLDFTIKSSRKVLYGFSALSSFAGALLIFLLFDQPYLKLVAAIFLINLITALLMNFRWKISVHNAAVATAGACLILFGLFNPEVFYSKITGFILLCAALPAVSWSRYRLNVHTVPELIAGLALGIISTGITAFIWHLL